MKAENAARAVARHMGWAGARGGWIFDGERQPLAAGLHALAERLEARGWIVPQADGYRVEWQRIPGPGTYRPRADRPLEPHPRGPAHPDGPPNPAAVLPPPVRANQPTPPCWYAVPAVFRPGASPVAVAIATARAWQAAQKAGFDPGPIVATRPQADAVAATMTNHTGILWLICPGDPGDDE